MNAIVNLIDILKYTINYMLLTRKKTKISVTPDYMPQLFLKNNTSNTWYNRNQQSTYELCCYIRRKLNKTGEWSDKLYDTVKNDQMKYGTYAGLDNWSHIFTDSQFVHFKNLVHTLE